MLLILLILIPLITGLLCFLFKSEAVKIWAFCSSIATLIVSIIAFCAVKDQTLAFHAPWIPSLGASFSLEAQGMGAMLTLLTAIVFSITLLTQWNKSVSNPHKFMGLLLLAQAGLMGVFLANDFLLFYFFWELALIPVYFLASMWGGEKRIKASFKFFIYTFLGSLIMLAGLIFLYINSNGSFSFESIVAAGQSLTFGQQQILFWFIFGAFAIKMPIFPFHTWQPDAYEQTEMSVTIVLSALMVKMGLFATVKWLLPVLPEGVDYWSNAIMILSVIGIIYASILAFTQKDLKRLIAYSSIAHIGLMSLGIFAQTEIALNGMIIQMFNHGVNITGMWLILAMVEQRYQTRNLNELGGMAGVAPFISVALVIVAFANIGLPLTNSFIGEFMLFHGIFESANPNHIIFMVLAGTGIILSAIYTLNLVQKVAYGESKTDLSIQDVRMNEWLGLVLIIALIIIGGIYPNLFFKVIA